MPELPEVETIKRDLAKVLLGQKITFFKVTKPKLLRNPRKTFIDKLVGSYITSVKRRAKLLLIGLSSGYNLAIHLKMTGQLVWRPRVGKIRTDGHPITGVVQVPNKFTYITLKFSNGSWLYFNDVRQFGYWQLIPDDKLINQLQTYGPEPLSASFRVADFKQRLMRHPKANIKAVLLNQAVVAGLGNIYVDESLFVARVRPSRRVVSLKQSEIVAIWQAIKKVIKKAVKARGTSFNTYIDAAGKTGSYWQKRYVYGRANLKCWRCRQMIKKTVLVGRGTHYCASCQK